MVNCRTELFEDPGIPSENKDDELHILKILDDSELIDATLIQHNLMGTPQKRLGDNDFGRTHGRHVGSRVTNWKWTSKYDIGGWVESI